MKNKQNEIKQKRRISKSKICIAVAFLFGIFSFFAPILFTRFSIYDLTESDNSIIADTIYGLTGPFIAIGAAILTFAAFFVQKEANDIQIIYNKSQYENDQIDSFENKLFNLIELHRDNAEKISFSPELSGQNAINSFNFTIYFVQQYLIKHFNLQNEFNNKDIQIFSYLISTYSESLLNDDFFKASEKLKKYTTNKSIIQECIKYVENVKNTGSIYYGDMTPLTKKYLNNLRSKIKLISIDSDNMNLLSKYFRQLFYIYKYIDKQTFLDQEQKYEYAKIVRTSISNAEQELIYNDILSPFGNKWRVYNLVKKYQPFKNILSDRTLLYSPSNYFLEVENISQIELEKYIDIL